MLRNFIARITKRLPQDSPYRSPSPLVELRGLIGWSSPDPNFTFIICNPALISHQLLTEIGLGSAVLSKDASNVYSHTEQSQRHILVASSETADLTEIIENSKDIVDLIVSAGYEAGTFAGRLGR